MDAKICLSQHKTNWDGMLKMEKFRCKQRCEQGVESGDSRARKLQAPHFQKHPRKVKQNAHQPLIFKEIVRSNRKSTPMGFDENVSKIFSGH